MGGPRMGSAPVMPNASLVTGTVQTLKPPAPENQRIVLELLVRRAEDIVGMANFVADEVGNTIPITLRGTIKDTLPPPQAQVTLRVEFRGDEWGGGYYANAEDLEPIKQPESDE